MFIDFLALFYNVDTLFEKKKHFEYLFSKNNSVEKKNILFEISAIQKAINDKSKSFPELIKKISIEISKGNFKEAKEIYFTNISENENDINLIISSILFSLDKYSVALEYFEKINEDALSRIGKELSKRLNFYNEYSLTLLILFSATKNEEYLNKAFKLTKEFLDREKDVIMEFISSRLLKINLISRNDSLLEKNYLDEVLKIDFDKIDVKFKDIIQELVLINQNNEKENYTNHYIEYFSNLNINERLEKYKLFNDKFFYIFFVISNVIEKDLINNNLSEILNDWFTNMLIYIYNSKVEEIDFLINFIERNTEYVNLTIQETYLKTYKEVVFNKNENAIFELPKEQREFFVKNILKRKN